MAHQGRFTPVSFKRPKERLRRPDSGVCDGIRPQILLNILKGRYHVFQSMQPLAEAASRDAPTKHGLLRVLVVEDSEDDYLLIVNLLSAAGYEVFSRQVDDAASMSAALREPWDLVIADHRLPRFSSMKALALLKERKLDIPFLIVSATIGEEVAVEALHAGASDYIMKDNLTRLPPAVERALAAVELQRARREAEFALQESEARFRAIAANLPGMVFQMHFAPHSGELFFSFVSEGAQALFGVPPRALTDNSRLFLERLETEDRESLKRTLADCAGRLALLRWEGRLVEGERWISMRASPREQEPGLLSWEGIVTDVTREKNAELEILESREQLRRLSAHVEKAKESERSRIAREIHDDIGGTLTAVKLDLAWLRGRVLENAALREKIQIMQQHLDSAMHSSIRIARDLRPSLLDYGIVPAIEWQLGDFQSRMRIPCTFLCTEEDTELDSELATAVFRIFQESLTNISKHAGARSVQVRFDATESTVELEVRDDGTGVSPDALDKPDSFGLRGMRERVKELGGRLELQSSPGAGTTLRLSLQRRAPAGGEQP